MTPQELWNHAQGLPEGSEAELRTKISRSYYALFSYACEFNNLLPSEGILLRKDAGCHFQLSQKLTNPTVTDGDLPFRSRVLGTNQKLAHELRVKADYDLDSVVTAVDMKKCITWVRKGMAIDLPAQKAA